MTLEHLAFHAAERPDALALIAQGREISFAQFHRDVGKVRQALQAIGRPAGSSVAVRCADIYFHWLLLLGFEALNVTTVSLDEREGDEAAGFLSTIDFVMSDVPLPVATEFFRIEADWHRRVFEAEPVAEGLIDVPSEAPPRILRTSGTTGLPKRLHSTQAIRNAWLEIIQGVLSFGMDTRLVMTLPFTVEGAYFTMTQCLRGGGTVIGVPFNQTGAIPDLLRRHVPDYMMLLPAQLKQLLDELPAGFERQAGLTLVTFGGAIGNELRAAALHHVANRLFDVYGTNEAGVVSLRRMPGPDGVGIMVPGVRVEIVDDEDRPLPETRAGRVRIRGNATFHGYLDDPAANQKMIRNGWFYPGDMGILLGNRRLKILGRGDELLNIGGIKIGPDSLEDRVRSLVPLADIGACSMRNGAGIGEVYLGVVKRAQDDDGIYDRLLQAVGTLGLGVFYLVKLDRVPRNPNGKIRRKQLKRAVADEILRHDPSWTGRVMLDPDELAGDDDKG